MSKLDELNAGLSAAVTARQGTIKTEKMCGVESILDVAKRLTRGDRNDSYGHPLDDYMRTAKMWSAILGVDVTPEQAMLCMIAVKISRECHRHDRDTIVDIAGYADCIQRSHEERELRSK